MNLLHYIDSISLCGGLFMRPLLVIGAGVASVVGTRNPWYVCVTGIGALHFDGLSLDRHVVACL